MNLPRPTRSATLVGVKSYGQYCPIARTSELLAERWTPIIVRNLLSGCRTFGDLLDGAPGISKALLAQRLELLEEQGIVAAESSTSHRRRTYALTEKGRELKTITDAMGAWGARWLELQAHDIDATYVLWATCRLVEVEKVPRDGLVVRIELVDRPKDRFWMLLRRSHAEICSSYPGQSEDLIVQTDSETLARWHLRHISYEEATKAGRIRIEGPRSHLRAFLGCIRPSPFAGVERASRAAVAAH
jgi:DNA-binding HxlR family transcriptional regulator